MWWQKNKADKPDKVGQPDQPEQADQPHSSDFSDKADKLGMFSKFGNFNKFIEFKQKIYSWFFAFARKSLKAESTSEIRRVQIFRLVGLCLFILGLSYGIIVFVFKGNPTQTKEDIPVRVPTLIETPTDKVGTEETWRVKMEDDNKKLADEILDLKTVLQESMAIKENTSQASGQDIDSRFEQFEFQLMEKLAHNASESQGQGSSSQEKVSSIFPQSSHGGGISQEGDLQQTENGIQKVTLGLSESRQPRSFKTVDTTIPAGSFAKTVLLSGLDASASMSASSDPRPMLLRMIDHGTLPRRFQSDLKDCHCTASAYGDLSSERVYARLEKMSCVTRRTGEILEIQVAGYIAGPDGKAGIRGVVASKDGQFLARSMVGGIFSGLSNVANPQNRQAQVNPFAQGQGAKQPSPPNIGDMFTAGMTSGISTALDRLSQYYIDRAEQLQPVIQIAAGQVVDIVFTEGASLERSSVADDNVAESRKQRPENSVADAR